MDAIEATEANKGAIDEPAQGITNNRMQAADAKYYPVKTPANLLTIPRELRDMIYKLLLREIAQLPFDRPVTFRWRGSIVKMSYRSLCLTNRQVREEAIQVFFDSNDFEVAVWAEIAPVPIYHLRLMKQIRLRSFVHTNTGAPLHCYVEMRTLAGNTEINVGVGDHRSRLVDGELQTKTQSSKEFGKILEVLEASKPSAKLLQQHAGDRGSGISVEKLTAIANELKWACDPL